MTQQPTHLGDDILNAWIDGIATDEERAIVDDHVATCETCAERLDELQLVKAMLGGLGDVTPPRSFQLTPVQAQKPTPLHRRESGTSLVRLLPLVRTLSVAAMLAVLILGGALALRPASNSLDTNSSVSSSFMPAGETGADDESLQNENPAPAPQQRGEVVDQGEAASAHDSTSNALTSEAQDASGTSSTDGLTGLEIATITTGVFAIVLGATWMGMSMSLRNGASR